ncbi:CinA family nicotinamide mononucleotide deamidase-related protein [Virgibacillus halophilus]|uniref:Putative competence-damage inducible protein n=2 Tax=Tigheibacillus halophilus TaxID=361280 RepID=A0ABU5CAS9_9BACI|nr:CinA family nicotinamide mononucleotide deamidase-related protein [Virgibacillus halophilus]
MISGLEMMEYAPSMDKIINHFERQGGIMTPNNRRQARVFKGAMVLLNDVGMAPGMIVEYRDNIWVFMPGVPKEMKAMFSGSVIPYLRNKFGDKEIIRSLVLRFNGIGESRLEHELIDLIQAQENPTIAPLAQDSGVVIRLTAKEKTAEKADELLEQAKQRILKRVGSYYYGDDETTLQERVVLLLQRKNYHIAAAESLTGGSFGKALTSVSGVSSVFRGSVVCYDPIVKKEVLEVSDMTIRQYGTVSKECATEMAENAKRLMHADIGVSFTGVAGPENLEGKPAGKVFIGISTAENTIEVEACQFSGNRSEIRKQSVIKALQLLLKYLND